MEPTTGRRGVALYGLTLLVAHPERRGSQPARPRPVWGEAAPQLGGAAGIPYCSGVELPRCTQRARCTPGHGTLTSEAEREWLREKSMSPDAARKAAPELALKFYLS